MRHESNTPGGTEIRQSPSQGAPAASVGHPSPAVSAGAPILLTDDQAAQVLGVSVRKFHELRQQAWLPQPIVLGPRLLRWPRAELEHAVANMPRLAAPAAEPAQLARARIDRMKRTGVPA